MHLPERQSWGEREKEKAPPNGYGHATIPTLLPLYRNFEQHASVPSVFTKLLEMDFELWLATWDPAPLTTRQRS